MKSSGPVLARLIRPCAARREPRFFPFAALLARVPWPPGARAAPLNPSPAALRRLADGAESLAPRGPIRMAYRFFYLPAEQGAALLGLAARAACEVLAADFKAPERNLELPAALLARCLPGLWPCSATGSAFADFLARGGLEGLAHGAGLQVLARRPLLGGAAVLMRLSGPGAPG